MTNRRALFRIEETVPSPTRAAALTLLLAAAAALGACGKKGDLDYPPGTQMESRTKPDGSVEQQPKRPNRPFVLDGLLN